MQQKIHFALAIVLLATIATPVNAATPTAGGKCPKAGVSETFAGKKYTCIKSGKKLFWNKGIAIKKATPTPSAKPIPTQTISGPKPGDSPLPSGGCSTGTFFYHFNNGVMERSFFEDQGFTKTDPRPDSSFDPVRIKAFKAVRDHFNSNQTIRARIQSNISPSFPKELLASLQNQLMQNVASWQDYFPASATVQATYFTGDDPSFADNSKQTMSGALEQYFMDELKKFKQYNCSLTSGVSGAHLVSAGPNSGQSGYWFAASSPPQKTYWAPWYQSHELTHSVQELIVKDIFSLNLPMNFVEGGAEFFGQALGYTNVGWYADEVDKRILEKHKYEFIMDVKSTADVIKMLEITESNSGPVAGGAAVPNAMRWSYSMGNLLWEWVTAEYGYEAYWNILKAININRSYDQSIKEVLGITKSQMYEKAAPFILSQFKISLARI